MSQIDCKVGAIISLFLLEKNDYILKQIWENLRQKLGQKWAFSAVFYYRRIGQLGRIFGRIISAEFGRIFGIGRTLHKIDFTLNLSDRKIMKFSHCEQQQ